MRPARACAAAGPRRRQQVEGLRLRRVPVGADSWPRPRGGVSLTPAPCEGRRGVRTITLPGNGAAAMGHVPHAGRRRAQGGAGQRRGGAGRGRGGAGQRRSRAAGRPEAQLLAT